MNHSGRHSAPRPLVGLATLEAARQQVLLTGTIARRQRLAHLHLLEVLPYLFQVASKPSP
ncbi:hypothetical protein BAY1663_01527 [Pseudomonas sp. BAY1663]|nr:hypothetical protein BAY1663_01527 [Pseudomonas sp. BAY1663]